MVAVSLLHRGRAWADGRGTVAALAVLQPLREELGLPGVGAAMMGMAKGWGFLVGLDPLLELRVW